MIKQIFGWIRINADLLSDSLSDQKPLSLARSFNLRNAAQTARRLIRVLQLKEVVGNVVFTKRVANPIGRHQETL